jgi:hypothetical protein
MNKTIKVALGPRVVFPFECWNFTRFKAFHNTTSPRGPAPILTSFQRSALYN